MHNHTNQTFIIHKSYVSVPLTLPNLQGPTANLYEEIREEVIQRRVRTEEVQEMKQEQVTVEDRRPQPVILEPRTAQPQRDVEDDWFHF